MRPFLILLSVLALVPVVQSADEAPLPAPVQAALNKYQETVTTAEREAYQKKQKAQADALKVIDKALTDATKAGNLDLANALKRKKDELATEEKFDLLTKAPEFQAPTSAGAWDKLEGKVVKVQSTQPLDLGELPAGVGIRLVPHPEDTWKGGNAEPACGFAGVPGSLYINLLPGMAMLITAGGKEQVINPTTVHSEGGKVTLRANDLVPGDNTGVIRVKIVAVR